MSFVWQEHLIENEVSILRRVKHPNIIMLVEEMETPAELFLVMELVKVRRQTGFIGVSLRAWSSQKVSYSRHICFTGGPSFIYSKLLWPLLISLDWTVDISLHLCFCPTGWRSLWCNYFFNQVHRERWQCHGVQPGQRPQVPAWPQHCTQRHQAWEPSGEFRIFAVSFSTQASALLKWSPCCENCNTWKMTLECKPVSQ